MREKDFKGAQVWIGADVLMRSLIVRRFSGRKISFDDRLVMISVFEGGVGRERGGRFERSRERPAERDRLEEGREECGELSVDIVAVVVKKVSRVLLGSYSCCCCC